MKRKMLELLAERSIRNAEKSANAASQVFNYQPKEPKNISELIQKARK